MKTTVDLNIAFCRTMLALVHKDVKAFAPEQNLRQPWVYHTGFDDWEFHGPDKFYWHGNADNAYDARAKGWSAWLQSKHAPGYGEEDEQV